MAGQDTIYKDKFDSFFAGIPDDIRILTQGASAVVQHFDIFTNPKRLTPFRNMVADENTTYEIVNFLWANSVLYGQGVVAASAKNKIFYKATDPITGSWTAASSGESASGARGTLLFKEFYNYIYLAAAGNPRISYYGDITGVPTFNETAYDLNGAGVGMPTAAGLITSDDLLLVPCGRYMVKKDGAGAGPTSNWSVALTLPANQTIVDQVEFGDLVAIATIPAAGYGGNNPSRVHLWDKVSPDVSATIDFGEGNIYVLDNMEGTLVGLINVGGQNTFGIRPRLVVRQWTGGTKADVIKEVQVDNATSFTVYGSNVKAKKGNKLVFGIQMTINGVAYHQLMALGRKNASYPYALAFDRLVDNDVAITSIQGLGDLGDYYFVAHNANGSVNRVNDQNSYGTGGTLATSVFITPKINGENQLQDASRWNKSMVMGGIITAPLTTGQSVSLYYRKDGDTSWTLVRTYSYGDDTPGMGFESGTIVGTGMGFDNFKEAQFKAIGNGGAEILAVPYAWKLAGADVISE